MLIQKLRLQRGWSQQQLADLSGLFSPFGADWEKRQVEKRLGRKL
jgi:transcriptional regulator with XRE-family HTH domain